MCSISKEGTDLGDFSFVYILLLFFTINNNYAFLLKKKVLEEQKLCQNMIEMQNYYLRWFDSSQKKVSYPKRFQLSSQKSHLKIIVNGIGEEP